LINNHAAICFSSVVFITTYDEPYTAITPLSSLGKGSTCQTSRLPTLANTRATLVNSSRLAVINKASRFANERIGLLAFCQAQLFSDNSRKNLNALIFSGFIKR